MRTYAPSGKTVTSTGIPAGCSSAPNCGWGWSTKNCIMVTQRKTEKAVTAREASAPEPYDCLINTPFYDGSLRIELLCEWPPQKVMLPILAQHLV
jgi:hypothetical protein